MAFDDRTLRKDDSPKSRVKAFSRKAVCVKHGSDYVVYASQERKSVLGGGRSAWDAWRSAEMIVANK